MNRISKCAIIAFVFVGSGEVRGVDQHSDTQKMSLQTGNNGVAALRGVTTAFLGSLFCNLCVKDVRIANALGAMFAASSDVLMYDYRGEVGGTATRVSANLLGCLAGTLVSGRGNDIQPNHIRELFVMSGVGLGTVFVLNFLNFLNSGVDKLRG